MCKVFAYCEKCSYKTGRMEEKELIYVVSMDGGYIKRDKKSDYISECQY